MPALLLCILSVAFVPADGGAGAVAWSPDGRWLAYTQTPYPVDRQLPAGWLFDGVGTAVPPEAQAIPRRTKLWATRPETGESVLLAEEAGPLSSPGWNAGGTAIAFARILTEGPGKSRLELVIKDDPSRQRIVYKEAAESASPSATSFAGSVVAWSPDSRYLVGPRLRSPGMVVVKVEDGQAVSQLDDAIQPSWSPDESSLAFYRTRGGEGLWLLDRPGGEPRKLANLTDPVRFPAPSWTRDGRSLMYIRPTQATAGPNPFAQQFRLAQIKVEAQNGPDEVVASLLPDEFDRRHPFVSAAMSIDREGQDVFYMLTCEGQDGQIVWARFRNGEVRKRFNGFDQSVPVSLLAASPAGELVAMRFQVLGRSSPPAFCNPDSERLTFLVPDDSSRAEWLGSLLQTMRGLLRDFIPPAMMGKSLVERATLLPTPGEIPANDITLGRLRNLARIGRPLCDRPVSLPVPDAALAAQIVEARFLFDYILAISQREGKGDYRPALASLDALESQTGNADQRVRLLGLRVQVLLGLREFDQADRALDYLRSAHPRVAVRLDETPAGPVLVQEKQPRDFWLDFLSARATDLKIRKVLPSPSDDPTGVDNVNFDAPRPGLGLDLPDAPK